jgi:hypothetical protein
MVGQDAPRLHHVVFAIAPERAGGGGRLVAEQGVAVQPAELTELGLRIGLDWERGIELISPLPESTGPIADSVRAFLSDGGDGVYTVVIQVPGASAAESVAKRYGAAVRFRQKMEGEGTHLEEIDLSVLSLPLTLLATNVP